MDIPEDDVEEVEDDVEEVRTICVYSLNLHANTVVGRSLAGNLKFSIRIAEFTTLAQIRSLREEVATALCKRPESFVFFSWRKEVGR